MSKLSAFESFKPSFVSVVVDSIQSLFKSAFEDASPTVRNLLAGPTGNVVTAEGVIGLGVKRSLRFGHVTDSSTSDLTGEAPYRLVITYDAQEELASLKLFVYLLNPRMVLADDTFIPARRSADGRYEALTPDPEPFGLRFQAPLDTTSSDRYAHLIDGLPEVTFTEPLPAGALAYNEDNLVSRLDFSIEWKNDVVGKKSADLFGRSIGIPNVELPANLPRVGIGMFSPSVVAPFSALLNATRGYALDLEHSQVEGIQIILAPPEDQVGKKLLSQVMAEFNLTVDFKGVIFEGLKAVWLDDNQYGQEDFPVVGLSLTAVSFAGGGESNSSWYTGFDATMTASTKKGYLNLFDNLKLTVSIADGIIANFKLRGTFTELDPPYAWLSRKNAILSLRIEKWKSLTGSSDYFKAIDLALEANGDEVLATLTKDSPVPMTAENFSQIAVCLTLAPIVLATNPVKVPDGVHPPDGKTREYFVKIGDGQSLGQLYVVAGLGWFFKNAVTISQLRVKGIRFQTQPAFLNDPTLDPDIYQTALLFDYEADFNIELDSADIKTTRSLTSRVDGTGFSVGDNDFTWVQVPSGLRELSVADPSLWELGKLGKIIKIVEMRVRRAPETQLVIRLRLTGNTDIVTAGDFVFVVPLEGDDPPRIEAFPSEIKVDIPGVVQGTGKLVISDVVGGKAISGSLDLVFPSGLRLFGAVSVAPVKGPNGNFVTASIFSASVRFPTPIPVFGTGVGWRGLEGLVATHNKRNEPVGTDAVPPALSWLKQAGGDVVSSITKPGLWEVAYDRTSVGLGVMLELMASGQLLNLNAMLVVEQPGPRILILAKANVLSDPKNNKDAASEVEKGIIGALDVDFNQDTVTLSALAELKFKDFVEFRAPLQLFFDMHRATRWHVFLGTFSDPITAKLHLFNILSFSTTAYFMAAGDVIKNFPTSPNQTVDLPGFALALGSATQMQVGVGGLYVRGSISTYLAISLSNGLFAKGGMDVSGELRLYIVSVGGNGSLELEYFRSKNGTESIYASGSICGHYENFFIDVSGCITLQLGSEITDPPVLPILTGRVSLLAGTDVALWGQGQGSPIDAVLAEAALEGSVDQIPEEIPLDAVITVEMALPPKITANARGFAGKAPRFNQNETRFNIGSRTGEYVLKDVSLRRKIFDGSFVDVDYSACPARWWVTGQSPKGGQPTPKTLALMTRNPLSAQNALVSSVQMKVWLDSILGGICDSVTPIQPCFYAPDSSQAGMPLDGQFVFSAVLRNSSTEMKIGRSGAVSSVLKFNRRKNFGPADGGQPPWDQLPGYPHFPGSCTAEIDSISKSPIAFLKLFSRPVNYSSPFSPFRVACGVTVIGEMFPGIPFELLLAHPESQNLDDLRFKVTTSTDRPLYVNYEDLLNTNMVSDLSWLSVRQDFYFNAENWFSQTESFARLANHPNYSDYKFLRAVLDFTKIALLPGEFVLSVEIVFNDDVEHQADIDVLIGGYRYAPLAEKHRFDADVDYQSETIGGLNGYFNGIPIPLLEPEAEYHVKVDWDAIIDGTAAVPCSSEFKFKTASEPPRSALPYLLATFPQPDEKFHSADDEIGFCLGSSDVFRILNKFPDARLKISITEDAGTAVTDSTGALAWHEGVIVDVADLIDPLRPPPKGIHTESVASLPSALKAALYDRLRDGSLSCLGNISLPNGGIWVGFDVKLLTLSGYRIVIKVVKADGTDWPWKVVSDSHFLEWRFTTSLHQGLVLQIAQLNELPVRNRVLSGPLSLEVGIMNSPLIVEEKVFEDELAKAMGCRTDRSGEGRVTLLWSVDGTQLTASWLLVEGREPLFRTTGGVRIVTSTAEDISIAKLEDLNLQSVELSRSSRVQSVAFSSSGCSCLVRVDINGSGDLIVMFNRHAIDRIPAATILDVPLVISGKTLRPRQTQEF